MIEGFCTRCGFKVESFEGLKECPQCGDSHPPCDFKEQVTIAVNWHELHILGVWAEYRANELDEKYPGSSEVVYAIMGRIEAQFPDKHALTMAHEIGDLAKNPRYSNLKTNVPNVDKFRE
jgi:hypothetical protein